MFVSLCAFAEQNKDGTWTLVRSGITYWEAPLPLDVRLYLFVELDPNSLSAGTLDLALEFTDANDVRLSRLTGAVELVSPELPFRLALPVEARVAAYGPCKVVAKIGHVPVSTDLHVKPIASQT
jgi:hypothetical protein